MDGDNIPLVINEAFTPTPLGLEYISTAKRLEEELVQHPTKDPNGIPISPSILAQLVLFYHYHVRATHPQYNYPEFQYYVEKYSWEWCYSDIASPNFLPFPRICPYVRSEKFRAVLPYEARLMPKFSVPRDPHPPTAPRYEEGNPWVHFRRLVPLMEEMWHVLNGIIRGNQGQTPQDLRQLRRFREAQNDPVSQHARSDFSQWEFYYCSKDRKAAFLFTSELWCLSPCLLGDAQWDHRAFDFLKISEDAQATPEQSTTKCVAISLFRLKNSTYSI
ncbi:hypothetical protein DL95DRAFT_507800 [Leptodontidium sp. 2 PMI_412]|nr:hypothetical protein DL95DRAFT_507800 [Leptodontidium sp. 2 PMI_412]